MNRSKFVRVTGIATTALCMGVAFGVPAQAQTGTTPGQGTCSSTSTMRLHASSKKQTIKLEAKAKTDVRGEAWDWTVSDNGSAVASGETTTGHNRKLVVRQSIPNLDGTDTVDFAATDTVTGETCTAEIVVAK